MLAALVAGASGVVAAAALFGSAPPPERVQTWEWDTAPQAPSGPAVSLPEYRAAIVERSVFDSTRVGGGPPPQVEPVQIGWVLLGTLLGRDPAFSSALLIADEKGALAQGYVVGDELEVGLTLVFVEHRRVGVQTEDGQVHVLTPPEPGERRKTRRENSGGGKVIVRRRDRNSYEVSDAALARVYEDPAAALDSVRARSYQTEGVRLSRVRGRSPLKRLGMRSGDVITQVNGQTVRSVEHLEDAWRSVEGEQEFTVKLRRRNKDKTLVYTLI